MKKNLKIKINTLKVNISKKVNNLNSNLFNLINFFSFFFKINFSFFFKINFFEKKLWNIIFYLSKIVIYSNLKFFINFYFVYIFSLFLFFKNPNILFEFLSYFFKVFSFKKQKMVHYMLYYFSKKINYRLLHYLNYDGIFIKFKGKYMKRPGDRRRTSMYKFYSYSPSDCYTFYDIFSKQLWNKSGSTQCLIQIKLRK